MNSAAARARRRAKCLEITLTLLETAPEGLRVSYIQKIIQDSCRFRINSNILGQVMKPHVTSGMILVSNTSEGHRHWKLNPVYIPVLETD
mgnify:FL=1